MKNEKKYPCPVCGRQSCTLSLTDLLKDIPSESRQNEKSNSNNPPEQKR